MKKFYVLLLVIAMSLYVVGCKNSTTSDFEKNDSSSITLDDTPITSSEAISTILNDYDIEQEIADTLNFYDYYEPEYGTTEADQGSDGYWHVIIKGNMYGYVDEYHSDIEMKKFSISASVSSDGEYILYKNVKQEYGR